MILYVTTTESLRSICGRLGLNYPSVNIYIRNHYPILHSLRKSPIVGEEELYAEGMEMLRTMEVSVLEVSRRLGYDAKFRTFLRTYHPELLVRKKGKSPNQRHGKSEVKYAKALSMIAKINKLPNNPIKVVAEECGLNYHSLRLYIYQHHREFIDGDTARNLPAARPDVAARYAKAIAILASLPKKPENPILYVAEKLGMKFHALRKYVYTYHPELCRIKRNRSKE